MKRLFLLAACFLIALQLSAQEQIVRFAFITDTHYGKAANNEDMLACIKDINSLKDSLEFVLMGGDLTNFGLDEQIAAAKKVMDRLEIPYWIVSGNHDSKWSESGCNTFVRTFGYEQFEFEAGGYRFLGCNCGPDMRMAPALVPRSSMNWIKSLERGKPVIFLNHYPLNDGMSNWFEVRRELLRLDCRYAIAGHTHTNKERDYFGLPGMTGRCGFRGKNVPGYNIFTIRDGVLTVSKRLLWPEGHETTEPWITQPLLPVQDTLTYDTDGLPEAKGVLNFRYAYDKINLSFGQGSTTTMLQLFQAYSAIFSDGTMVKPYFVESVRDSYNNSLIYQADTVVKGHADACARH